MCRFIGVMSKSEFDVEEYIDILEDTARNGKRSPHGDGWGIWLKNGDFELLHKETVPIWERKIRDFPSAKILFVHARKRGDNGKIAIMNTHPFVKKNAVFMHNGVINIEHSCSSGTTDSENMFLYIIESGLSNFLRNIEKYEFSSINSLLYMDGRVYAIRYANKMQDYYTIFLKKESNKIILSTDLDGYEIENKTVVVIYENLEIARYHICPDMPHLEGKLQNPQ